MKTASPQSVQPHQPALATAPTTMSANAVKAQFVVMDLFKMLCAAVLSGLVFSAVAAGLTLLLMHSAEASAMTTLNCFPATPITIAVESNPFWLNDPNCPITQTVQLHH